MTIWTIGHSTKQGQELVDKLKENGIDLLIDVRTKPYSHYNPQFNRPTLEKFLPHFEIAYKWYGDRLGGLGQNRDFEGAIGELIGFTSMGYKVCVMCSEGDPNKCHRKSLIQPELEKKGVAVAHILWNNKYIDNRQSLF